MFQDLGWTFRTENDTTLQKSLYRSGLFFSFYCTIKKRLDLCLTALMQLLSLLCAKPCYRMQKTQRPRAAYWRKLDWHKMALITIHTPHPPSSASYSAVRSRYQHQFTFEHTQPHSHTHRHGFPVHLSTTRLLFSPFNTLWQTM